jgi:hypothetical protein
MEQQDGSKRIRSHNAKNNAGVRRIEVPGAEQLWRRVVRCEMLVLCCCLCCSLLLLLPRCSPRRTRYTLLLLYG